MPKRVSARTAVERSAVTISATFKLDAVFQALVTRGQPPASARRFALQCAVFMFLEDTGELSDAPFRDFVRHAARGERVEPSNHGSHFFDFLSPIECIDFDADVASLLTDAAKEPWSSIDPAIFGELFQSTMTLSERHERGAHYTPNNAIFDYVVRPTLVDPWRARIRDASTLDALLAVRNALTQIRILDPSCGSGNFLYVAYRALTRLELDVVEKLVQRFPATNHYELLPLSSIQTRQLFGIDSDPFAVELAKVTLAMGKKLALDETHHALETRQLPLSLNPENALPVDNLDDNICCGDALFCDWPKADFIIGNPPFQSKNRMQQEFGPEYVQRLRKRYPDVPGRADYCVYWFRRAHDELPAGGFAGLVGTNTIRQNYSRQGGLDHIVKNGGTITEAVSTMVWPGEAIVHVSVVNWTKGPANGRKKLSWQEGDKRESHWHEKRLARIPASLSPDVDVTDAKTLRTNAESGACFQGQTHGHEGFLLSADEGLSMLAASKKNRDVIFPYLIGDDLLSNLDGKPSRWVIDFSPREQLSARQYVLPFQRIKNRVLADREKAADEEVLRNEPLDGGGNHHHSIFLKRWWLLSYPRGELMTRINSLTRYIVCSRVTKRPIFDFVSADIHPSDALAVFPLEDDYSFGILQSSLHWAWFTARCSTLTARFRYTSETVFDSFPWPQSPTEKQCLAVANAAVALRALRRQMASEKHMNLRAMYTSMEDPGAHPLKEAHAALDKAVRAAYAMPARKDLLAFLLNLNQKCADREAKGELINAPGLPTEMWSGAFVTKDCVRATHAKSNASTVRTPARAPRHVTTNSR